MQLVATLLNGDIMVKLTPFSIAEDFEIVFNAFSDKNTQPLISNRISIKSKECFRDWLIFQLRNHYHEFKIINYNDEKIGFCYSYDYVDETTKTVMYIKKEYQTSGIGALAEIVFIDYLLDIYPIRKIYNHVYSYNTQSLNSHLKAGFNTEGKLLAYRYYAGNYHDLYILSITREEFYRRYKNLLQNQQEGASKNVQ